MCSPFVLQQGKELVQLPDSPKKIAVYDLSALDIFNSLGIPVQIVPKSTFSGNLAHFQQEQFIKAGSLFEPDFQILKQEKADLIIVGGRSAKAIDQVKALHQC